MVWAYPMAPHSVTGHLVGRNGPFVLSKVKLETRDQLALTDSLASDLSNSFSLGLLYQCLRGTWYLTEMSCEPKGNALCLNK